MTAGTPDGPAGTPEGPAGADEGPAGADDARRALADAVRRLTVSVVADAIDPDDLRRAAATVGQVADALQAATTGPLVRSHPDPRRGAASFFPTSPVVGGCNPVASPVRVWDEDGAVAGEAWFDLPYEGPPTCVHGGVIAMVFDELLGMANIVAGRGAMTGTLTVKYRRPTPLRQPLQVWARSLSADGRKVRAEGAIVHDGRVTAQASGLFVAVAPDRFLAMVADQGGDPEAWAGAVGAGLAPAAAGGGIPTFDTQGADPDT